MVVVFFGLRKKSVVPGKLQSAVESIFTFVKDEMVNITQHSVDQMIFGYSFFPNLEITKLLCKP